MKADDTVIEILHEVKAEIKEELGLDISIPEIGKILHSQFEGAIFAMSKGVEIRLTGIGSFKRKYKEEIAEGKRKLKELKGILNEEELAAKELEMKLAKIARYKSKHNPRKTTDLKTLLETKTQFSAKSMFNKIDNV